MVIGEKVRQKSAEGPLRTVKAVIAQGYIVCTWHTSRENVPTACRAAGDLEAWRNKILTIFAPYITQPGSLRDQTANAEQRGNGTSDPKADASLPLFSAAAPFPENNDQVIRGHLEG